MFIVSSNKDFTWHKIHELIKVYIYLENVLKTEQVMSLTFRETWNEGYILTMCRLKYVL
jgi:hypothetical protein